jgi:hypothetical protein
MPRDKSAKRHGVTLNAVIQRLNRYLDRKDHIVRAPRGRGHGERTYFIVDSKHNAIVANGLTAAQLEKLARQHGVLAD